MLSRVIGFVESLIVRAARSEHRFPPLFVVGAPRSGTTVVIQHIINSLEFAYFPNLAKEHPSACITYGYLARRRHTFEPSYKSAYGVIDGPMAPSDGWDIMHRWFPRYDHDRSVRVERLHELRTIVRAYEKMFDAPFANKNNANSYRIPHLRAVFPDAFFVHVHRDLGDTVRSVLKSRKANNVDPAEWWGVAPPRFFDKVFSSELERVTTQTWDVERFIANAIADLPASRRLEVVHEEFRVRPEHTVEWTVSAYREAGVTLERRPNEHIPEFTGTTSSGDAEMDAAIRKIVERLEAEYPS